MPDAELSEQEIRDLVAMGCSVLSASGQNDMIWGHVSCRDPAGRGIWMKGHELGFDEVTPDDVLLLSWDGDVLEGRRRRHSEYPIHTEIMRARADVSCVVHTHARQANAFAATGRPLRPISHDGCLFVPPDIARFSLTGDLILTAVLGSHVANAIGDRNAMLIPNHGLVTVGATVAQGVMTAVLLARACEVQLLAGEVMNWSPDEEALAKRERVWSAAQLDLGWDYLVRGVVAARAVSPSRS
jgi:L-fuculose-phosphate aldolase